MSRLFPLALVCLLISPALADDAPKKEKPGKAAEGAAEKTPSQKLKEDPNDKDAIIALVGSALRELDESKPDEAIKKLTSLKEELEALKPDKEAIKELVTEGKSAVANYLDRLEIIKTPLADLEKRLDAEGGADDIAAVIKYGKKVAMEVSKLSDENPAQAE